MRSATRWQDKLSYLLGLTKNKKCTSSTNVYSEPVYRDLIHRESKRSKRSDHPCRILLVYHTNIQKRVVSFRSELVDKIISALFSSCRDTDYIGWYQENRILGVLLTTLGPDPATDGYDCVKTRLVDSLRGILTFTDDDSLQIRVLDQSELTAFNVSNHPAPCSDSND